MPEGVVRNPRVQVGGLILIAVAAVVVAWLLLGRDDSSPSARPPQTVAETPPIKVSPRGLRTLSAAFNEPIYWIGPRSGYTYELTRLSDGKIYVRYLPPGVKVNEEQGQHTIVATYPFPDALEALEETAGEHFDVPGGGTGLVDATRTTSVHLAFPDEDFQVEVFDPAPGRARELAESGDVAPVG
jgi:hypothetical protein